jgi:hypothetical protein
MGSNLVYMPYYLFSNPDSKEIIEIFFHMNDEKIYIDENGTKWNREFTVPQASIDVNIDPFSKKAFMDKTNKAGTFGEMFDISKEMSEKRGGPKNDPIKKEHMKDWKKKRNLKHTPKPLQ